MSHAGDYAWAPLIATLADRASSILPASFFDDLTTIKGETTFEAQAWYPPYDIETRNLTTWLSEKVTIGGMSFNQTQVGGAVADVVSFSPAVVQWDTGDEVAFLTVSSSSSVLGARCRGGGCRVEDVVQRTCELLTGYSSAPPKRSSAPKSPPTPSP